jgi:sodium-independent sulfate anion transporter 11
LKSQVPVVIDCTHVYGADFTAAKVVETLVKDFNLRKQPIIFFNLKPSVCNVFEGVDLDFKLYYDYQALERAIEELNLIGSGHSLASSRSVLETAQSA